MQTSLQALVPIFAYFAIGVVLRRLHLCTVEQAQFVFRLVFFVTLPPLAFTAISGSDLGPRSLALPASGFMVNMFCALLAYVYARLAQLDVLSTGTVIVGTSVTNTVFIFPFIVGVLGREALAEAVIYDIGNAIFVGTCAYAIALHYGAGSKTSLVSSIGRVFRTPIFIAVLAAITVNLAGAEVPALLASILEPLGNTTVPLVLIALGISFSFARLRDSVVYGTVLIRMAGGLLAGSLCVILFGLQGVTAVVVIASASAPIGFNSVTLASVGKLDIEHATASLSVSVAIGLLTAAAIVLIGASAS